MPASKNSRETGMRGACKPDFGLQAPAKIAIGGKFTEIFNTTL